MLTIKSIKNQLKTVRNEQIVILNTNKDFTRLLELKNLELLLSTELIKILETQLNKKTNVRKAG